MHPTMNTISENVRARSVALLQTHLVHAIDLKLQAKQAHWNAKGPSFHGLHALFDEIAGEADEWTDTIAERLVALGGTAEGTIQAVAPRTALPVYPLEIQGGLAHVDAMAHALAVFGTSVRTAIDTATGFGDADTADVFTEVSRAADKRLWMVEAHRGPA